jgi:tellurite resistance protein
MNEQEQQAILTLSLMAAFADGHKDESERAELKRIADALAGEGSINLAPLYQDVLLKRVSMASAVAALKTPEARQLAFEMAVCVCDADGVQSAAEQAFLADLRGALALDLQQSAVYAAGGSDRGAAVAAGAAAATDHRRRHRSHSAAGYASTLSETELEQAILNAAILNGALELLPESLSTMAIIPLQMKLVYRIGKSYGFELDRGHIKDFLATLGVGLTSQYLEQAGRKLLGGLLGKIGGGLLGRPRQAGGEFGHEFRQHLCARPRRQALLRRWPQLLDADAARSFRRHARRGQGPAKPLSARDAGQSANAGYGPDRRTGPTGLTPDAR